MGGADGDHLESSPQWKKMLWVRALPRAASGPYKDANACMQIKLRMKRSSAYSTVKGVVIDWHHYSRGAASPPPSPSTFLPLKACV